jgi:nitrogen fixation protein NifX
VYDVTPTSSNFVESFEFGDKLEEDGDEDKLAPKLDAIKDVAILYVAAIGGSGAARVVAMKIHPIKVPQPESITEILAKFQVLLQGTPPPWLRKALAKDGERSFDFEDEEVTS